MELALYCPVYGYYEAEGDKIGRRGDFYTSVSVGRLFGQLLACQFADWFSFPTAVPGCQLPGPGCHAQGQCNAPGGHGVGPHQPFFRLVEAGAHRGDLALDILQWFRTYRPAELEGLRYWILEPSSTRRGWQKERLAEFGSIVNWAKDVKELQEPSGISSPRSVTIIFSNELLDAMPVHRVGWDATQRKWFEWGVRAEQDAFVWTHLPLDSRLLASWVEASGFPSLSELTDVLPDGFTLEFSPEAVAWWRETALALGPGKLVAFDYGGTADELLLPERRRGTLRAYRHHQACPDPLAAPGEQDLTAHVNFTALQHAGAAAGLQTQMFVTQTQFLTAIAAGIWERKVPFEEWTPELARQFQTLTHPQHLGRAFRVLVQSRV